MSSLKDKTVKIYTDGGSRGNPGPAAVGVVVMVGDKVVKRLKKTIGLATNNTAEYQALLLSLDYLKNQSARPKEVKWFLDSKLVVEQVGGRWKVKDAKLKLLKQQAVKELKQLQVKFSLTHIPREKNKLADELVNQALDLNVSNESK